MRSEFKSILILTLFSYLMWDYLTLATIGFSSLGLLLIGLKIRVPKNLRTIIAMTVFASYWFKYGKVIDPEVGLNFLTSVVILKLLERESLRDSYMIFFGLILLLSAGALFEKTLTYVFFFTSSFVILLFDFYGTLTIKSRTKDLLIGFLWVVPMTCVLFFAVPRIISPLAFKSGSPSGGEVGYTPNVRLSEIDSLELNDDPVFQVIVGTPIVSEKLYWRGNVLAQNDGWNWTSSQSDHLITRSDKNLVLGEGQIRQKIRMFAKEPYLFGLDHPEKFILNRHTVIPDDLRALQQLSDEWNPRYEVVSRLEPISPEKDPGDRFQNVVLSLKLRNWIQEKFPSGDLQGLRLDIQKFFREEGFSYSLKPGRIINFREFVLDKKTGFCGHYASATAIILRARGIPARLVSGFQGGNYNSYANYYLVTQNDAHVWVEAYSDGKWVRLDPTAWIAPERLTLGGEAFLGAVAAAQGGNPLSRLNLNLQWVRDAQMWFSQWDFKFYQWLEEMDYYGQDAILSKFKFKREWLYTFAPLFIAFFLAMFAWQTRRREDTLGLSVHERAWKEFIVKVESKGLQLVPVSVSENAVKLSSWEHPEREKVTELWNDLVKSSFGGQESDWKILRKKIRRL